jgi:iron(III) transport system permease protein
MTAPPSRTLVIGAACAVFAACSILPVVYLIVAATDGGAAFTAPWLDVRQRGLLWTTTLLGAGAAAGATVLGVPLGAALARVPLPGKGLLRLALAAPIVLPPYTVALAWTYLGGAIHGLTAAIVISALVYYPLPMLATEVAMRRIDGRLEEAGLLVAPPRSVVAAITLPLAAPAMLAAALLVFVLAVSEFGLPSLLRVRVYTTEVFTAFAALYDFGRAVAVALPLVLLTVVVASAAAGVAGGRVTAPRRASGAPPMQLPRARRLATALVLAAVALALAVPLALLAREAAGARSIAAALEGSWPAVRSSLVLSALGATAVLVAAMPLGYARARASARTARVADVVLVAAFAVPSTIVGVGLIGLWNRPGLPGAAYGTDVMLVLAHLARFVPVAALILAATIASVSVSQEESAAVSGAGWVRTVSRLVLPQIRGGLLAAWAVAFVMAFGELGVSILVAPPGDATLPIRIYTIIANTPASHVAALALLQAGVVLAPLALAAAAVARPRRS